jgi:hypothetical protein
MGVKLYYGVAPAQLGPFTVQPQSVWFEGNLRNIKGQQFIECAVEGNNKVAPVARAIVEAIAEQSMNFSFGVDDIWPDGIALDPALEAEVAASIPDPEPAKPEPVPESAKPQQPVPADVNSDSLGLAIAAISTDVLTSRDRRGMHLAVMIDGKVREIMHDYGMSDVVRHPNFKDLATLFDEAVNDAFNVGGYALEDLPPACAPYIMAWQAEISGLPEDFFSLLYQFTNVIEFALNSTARMTYPNIPRYKVIREYLVNATRNQYSYFESLMPRYMVGKVRQDYNRNASGNMFDDMRVAERCLRTLSDYVDQMETFYRDVPKTPTGAYPEWFALRYICSFIDGGCEGVVPFSSMRNSPANTQEEMDPICRWFVDTLISIEPNKHVTHVANALSVIMRMAPETRTEGYDPAEDRRWPAIASLYRFLKNGVWEKYATAGNAVTETCEAELNRMIEAAAPTQNVTVYGYQPANIHASKIRNYANEALKKGNIYSAPVITFINDGMVGVNPLSSIAVNTFDELWEHVEWMLKEFAAQRLVQYRESSVGKVENAPRDLTISDVLDQIGAARDLTAQWRPFGMRPTQFETQARGLGLRAVLASKFSNWYNEVDLKVIAETIVREASEKLDKIKSAPTPEEQWNDIVAETRGMFIVQRPANLEQLTLTNIDEWERATTHLRKMGDLLYEALGDELDVSITRQAFVDLGLLAPNLSFEQYMDAAVCIARLYNKRANSPLSPRESALKGLTAVYDMLSDLRPIGKTAREGRSTAPQRYRDVFSRVRNLNIDDKALADFIKQCFPVEDDFGDFTFKFINAMSLTGMRPMAKIAPSLTDMRDYNQVLLEWRAKFRDRATDIDQERYGKWWDDYMSGGSEAYLPINMRMGWDEVAALIQSCAARSSLRSEPELRGFIENLCSELMEMANYMRPLFMTPIRWGEVAPKPFYYAIESLTDIVDGTAYGTVNVNNLLKAALPKTGTGTDIEIEIAGMVAQLNGIANQRVRMRRGASMLHDLRMRAAQDPLVYSKWEGAFSEFKHAPVTGLTTTMMFDSLLAKANSFVDELIGDQKGTTEQIAGHMVDAIQAVLEAAIEMRPLDMSATAWNDLKMRAQVAPAIRGATTQLRAFLSVPENVINHVLKRWVSSISDRDRYGKDGQPQSVPRAKEGKISYTSFDEGSGDAEYRMVVPSTPPTGVDNAEVFTGSVSYQANKIFEAALRQGFNGGRTYRLPDEILEDLAKHSKCLGITRKLPAGNFVVVGTEGSGATCIATFNSGGRMVSVIYVNMAEIAQHLGGANTQSVLHALTHEFAHYFHKGLKGTALLDWKKATSGRKLHPAQGRDAYAFDTEQFAILAETMVCGNSVRGLYNCNGINVVERFFVNNFITPEDRQKLA